MTTAEVGSTFLCNVYDSFGEHLFVTEKTSLPLLGFEPVEEPVQKEEHCKRCGKVKMNRSGPGSSSHHCSCIYSGKEEQEKDYSKKDWMRTAREDYVEENTGKGGMNYMNFRDYIEKHMPQPKTEVSDTSVGYECFVEKLKELHFTESEIQRILKAVVDCLPHLNYSKGESLDTPSVDTVKLSCGHTLPKVFTSPFQGCDGSCDTCTNYMNAHTPL